MKHHNERGIHEENKTGSPMVFSGARLLFYGNVEFMISVISITLI